MNGAGTSNQPQSPGKRSTGQRESEPRAQGGQGHRKHPWRTSPTSLTLQTNPDGISRAVAVISAGGRKLWTDADRLTPAALKGSRVIRNRRGNIVEIHLEAHHEAAIASRISAHNKGNAFRQPLQVGWVWALTGTSDNRGAFEPIWDIWEDV